MQFGSFHEGMMGMQDTIHFGQFGVRQRDDAAPPVPSFGKFGPMVRADGRGGHGGHASQPREPINLGRFGARESETSMIDVTTISGPFAIPGRPDPGLIAALRKRISGSVFAGSNWTFVNCTSRKFGVMSFKDSEKEQPIMDGIEIVNGDYEGIPLELSFDPVGYRIVIRSIDADLVESAWNAIHEFLYRTRDLSICLSDIFKKKCLRQAFPTAGAVTSGRSTRYWSTGDSLMVEAVTGSFLVRDGASNPALETFLSANQVPCVRAMNDVYVNPYSTFVQLDRSLHDKVAWVIQGVDAYCQELSLENGIVTAIWNGYTACFHIVSTNKSYHSVVRQWLEKSQRECGAWWMGCSASEHVPDAKKTSLKRIACEYQHAEPKREHITSSANSHIDQDD